jgi:hypothetical protein
VLTFAEQDHLEPLGHDPGLPLACLSVLSSPFQLEAHPEPRSDLRELLTDFFFFSGQV